MTRAQGFALVALVATPLAGQAVPTLPPPGAPMAQWSGELGTYGELYHRAGQPAHRPGGSARLYFNGNVVLFGTLQMGVDLLASTEDRTTLGYSAVPGRQNIRQFGLHPTWAWGRAHAGAFSESYSPYTYSGVQLSGAAVDVSPGLMRFGLFGGRAAAPVSGGATTGSFKRSIAGGRVGIGRRDLGRPSNYLDLMVVRAWDDPKSLAVDTTLPPNAPTAGDSAPVNPYAVTPEDNLVVGGAGGVVLLEGRLAWRGELAAAVHSRDRRASALDPAEADVPGILSSLITPRVSTHYDYAYSTELQFRAPNLPGATPSRPRALTATLAYRHVGPGYTSLGVASLGNDVRALDGRANVRFTRWTAQLQAARQNDNLIGQKLHTTTRYRLGGTFTLRVTPIWNANLRTSLLTMGNGAADTLQWMDYTTWSFGMGHSFSFGPRKRFESLAFDYHYQDAGDANPRRASTTFRSHAANARLTIRFGPAFQVTPTVGYARSRSDTAAAISRAVYGVGAAWRLPGGRLTTTGSLARSQYSRSNIWNAALDSRYGITSRDDLVLRLQFNRFRDTAGAGSWYNEQIASLRWARRF